MSDEQVSFMSQAPGAGEKSAGAMLREAREASGMQIGALANAMKVPVKKLEALEADRLDELPDAVFIRALAASVCRTLRIDPVPVLNRLPQLVISQLQKNEPGISMPVRGPGLFVTRSLLNFLSTPTAIVVLVLLLAALAVVTVPASRSPGGAPAALQPAQPASAAQAAVQTVVQAVVPAKVEPEPASISMPVASASASATVAEAVVPAKAVSAAVAPIPQASQPASAVAGVLVFHAKASAWVRVRDGTGVIVFEKTLAAGESIAVPGQPPLSVVVGNVAATEVAVRGQPFSLEALNQNNVARFEVK